MKHRLWIAICSILLQCGWTVEASRGQSGLQGSTAAGGSAAAGVGPQLDSRRPEPTVIGRYEPGTRAPVAMLGYSPVSLLNSRQWVKGNERYKAIFDGAAYLLSDERELQIFRAAPERYLPALGGDCVVHFVKTGRRRPGMLRHGVAHEGRLFFLSSSENKQAFVDDPEPYMDADLALDGNCPVCLVELNKTIPGQTELAAVLGGYRYLFPGAQQREMFLAQPMKYAAGAHAIAGKGLPAGPAAASLLPVGPGTNDSQGENRTARTGEPAASEATPGREELPTPFASAMAGYCPVSILDENRWVRGQQQMALVHDGRRYLFAGERQQQAFLKDPVRYVPALGGDCVVTFKDLGQRVEGSVYQAVIHRGRQYLFPDRPRKEKFKETPEVYANVDLALGGLCPVRLAETGEQIDGKREFTLWQGGLRFQLAGVEEMEMFQNNPGKYAAEAEKRLEDATPDTTDDDFNPFDS